MLYEFIAENRAEIIARCRAKISSRPAPRPTDAELSHGVPLFLEQPIAAIRDTPSRTPEITVTAGRHGRELLARGFSVAQVVHDYGGICQTITELAVEKDAAITSLEFKSLNRYLDEAIAEAVSEYAGQRANEGTERMGRMAHELRNLLNTAMLSFDAIKSGDVGINGSVGAMLGKSLAGLRRVVDRELMEVRLDAGIADHQVFAVSALVEDIEVIATLDANQRNRRFSVESLATPVMLRGDRQILESVVVNLLQNAFKFTAPQGKVLLRVRATDDRVLMDVADECGGLPSGRAEAMFEPFEQRSADRSGLGLGLSICYRGARQNGGEIRVGDRLHLHVGSAALRGAAASDHVVARGRAGDRASASTRASSRCRAWRGSAYAASR